MFRKGGSPNKGIMTGLVDRKQYGNGSIDEEAVKGNVETLEKKMIQEHLEQIKQLLVQD